MNDNDLHYYRLKYNMLYIDPLCGWPWLEVHEHDLDNWTPTIEIDRPGSHFKFTIRDREAMKAVSRVIREK